MKMEKELESEVLERYFTSAKIKAREVRVKYLSKTSLSSSDIDPIPPELIGAVDVRRLRKSAGGNAEWAEGVMKYLLGEDPPVPQEGCPPHVRVLCPGVVPELLRIGLLERCRGMTKAACGLFTVPKKNGKLRVIFDARAANALTRRHSTPLALFQLNELLQSWSLCGGKVTTIDFRHFFYQLPLAEVWRNFFVVTSGGTRYRPTAVTMGWQDAPLIAQVVTWLVTLYTEQRDPDLRVELVHEGGLMPKYAMLRGSKRNTEGYLFVLLDGIAIMSARRHVHEQWIKRILRNAKIFNVQVKEVTEGTFAGVVFDGEGTVRWRPEAVLNDWEAPGTRREVAEQLGELLWQMRVLQEELLEHEALMRLYSRVGSAACGWDEPLSLEEEELETLRAHWGRYSQMRWAEPRGEVTAEEWLWAVTDATPTSEATIVFTNQGTVVQQVVHSGLPKEAQAYREMGAIVTAAVLAGPSKGLLVATDADVCRFAIEKRYSRSPALRHCLRTIYEKCKIVKVLRVSSEENPADER